MGVNFAQQAIHFSRMQKANREIAYANDLIAHWQTRAEDAEHEARRKAGGLMNAEARIEALQVMLERAMYFIYVERQPHGDGEKWVREFGRSLNNAGDRAYQRYFRERGHTERDEDGNIYVDGPYRVRAHRPEKEQLDWGRLKTKFDEFDRGRAEMRRRKKATREVAHAT